MKKGHIKSYGAGHGVITPDDDSADVVFLGTVFEGPGVPTARAAVEYALYPGGGEPEAQKVVLV